MKNKLSIFALILVLWGGTWAQAFAFTGTWINPNSLIPKLEITNERDLIFISAWGRSESGLRHMGTVAGRYLSPVSSYNSSVLTATYGSDGDILNLRLTQDEQGMRVRISGTYTEVEYLTYRKEYTENNKKWNGSISGEILGPAKSTASIFQILLYGPDNGNRLINRQALGRNKEFSFEGLPDGIYWMVVKARGATRILPFPSEKKIIIQNGEAIHQDVELK